MKSKTFQILLVSLLVGCFACNQEGKKQLQSKVEHDTTVAFDSLHKILGKVNEGETVGCYFSFTNTGDHPLIINKVKPGCGCTAVKYPKKPILPGENGEIEVRFDSRGFSGHQYKVIQIHANIKEKMKELVVSANVIN